MFPTISTDQQVALRNMLWGIYMFTYFCLLFILLQIRSSSTRSPTRHCFRDSSAIPLWPTPLNARVASCPAYSIMTSYPPGCWKLSLENNVVITLHYLLKGILHRRERMWYRIHSRRWPPNNRNVSRGMRLHPKWTTAGMEERCCWI